MEDRIDIETGEHAMPSDGFADGRRGTRFLLTAEEAFPALERCFLDARTEIQAGFRIFDPTTKLRSREALKIGKTWLDLFRYVLSRGVNIRIVISDFDPIAKPALHIMTTRAVRQLRNLGADRGGAAGKLEVEAAMHGGRVGIVPRAVLWWRIRSELRNQLKVLNALPEAERPEALADRPGIHPWIVSNSEGRLRARLWCLPPLVPATHHHKIAVFDRTRLYIGGLDLNDRRYDTKDHDLPADETWHDLQLLVDDPDIVAEAQVHMEEYLRVTGGDIKPPPAAHLLRTMSRCRRWPAFYMSPKTVADDLYHAHLRAIRSARHLIYIETQYFRDRRIAKALAARARAVPSLKIIVVLPAAPDDIAFDHSESIDLRHGEYLQTACVRRLQKTLGRRVIVVSPARRCSAEGKRDTLFHAPIIYVHSKVSIFDDANAIVSSGNLNGRSMAWDTEAGVSLRQEREVADLRRRCLEHWVPDLKCDWALDSDPVGTVARIANSNATAAPSEREGFLLPYPVDQSARFGSEVAVLPDEMV